MTTTDQTEDQTKHFMDTVHQAVILRMEAGAHPHDAMMLGYSMIEAWVHVHINGEYPREGA